MFSVGLPEEIIVRADSGRTYVLGEGLSYQFYKVTDQSTGKEYLLMRCLQRAEFSSEKTNHESLTGCPHTLQMVDTCDQLQVNAHQALIFSHLSGTPLKKVWYLKYVKSKGQLDIAMNCLSQLLETLAWMNSKGLVMRSISPENIWVDKKGNVTLVGMKFLANNDTLRGEYLPGYHSPRCIASGRAKHEDDVFALLTIFLPIILSDFWMGYYRGHLTEQRRIEVYYQDGLSGKLKENVRDAIEKRLSFLTLGQKEVISSIFTDSFGNASASDLLEKIKQF